MDDVFADWFVAGCFRQTTSLTLNDTHLDLGAQGNRRSLTIGDTRYVATPDGRWSVFAPFPPATP